jgi:O-antigen/teichoic acid export membrane protein
MIFRAQSRMARILLTAGATYLGRFGSGVVILVTLPMAREALSTELFGVWMMLSSLLAFLAFADLGVGNGVLNRITHAHATQDNVMLRRTVFSGYVVTAAVGVILLLSWLCWLQWSAEPTVLAGDIAVVHRPEVLNALSAFVVVLAVNVPASLVQRMQLGMQEGYWNGLVQLLCAITTLIAVPLTLHSGGAVAVLVLATLGVQAAGNVLNTLIWLGRHQFLRMESWQGAIDAKTFVDLLRSGSLFFMLQVAAAFAFQSDAIVITQTLGQIAYGDFAVVQKLFLFVSTLLASAIAGLWPAFGDAVARKDTEWAIKTLRRGAVFTAMISIIGVSVLTIAMPWLLETWMADMVKLSWPLIAALAVWTVIESTASVLAAYMNGANILRAQVLIAIVMALAAFGGKWILVPWVGVVGATLSTILAYSVISLPAQFFIFKSIFKNEDR